MTKLAAGIKVLVVDDQPQVVTELCEFLQNHGYLCVPSHESRHALQCFAEDVDIGLVVCDLDLPVLDGVALIHALQQIAGRRRPFEAIMMTRQADKQNVIRAMRAGFVDYYQKPIALGELLEGLGRHAATLAQRQDSHVRLRQLNEKLHYLAESIDDLYQDLDQARLPAPVSAAAPGRDRGIADPVPGFGQLSPRQLAVAQLVGKGQTNYQIACELGITENTVKLYVSQVLRLTHMHNRTQLALALSPRQPPGRQHQTSH